MDAVVNPVRRPLRGEVRVPGDKSISHRAVLFAAMADGVSHLRGVLDSADVRSTIEAVRALGARVAVTGAGPGAGLELEVLGWGESGPRAPDGPVDCGNSGTTARLLLGVLAGWPVTVTLTGDGSLSSRPMRRIAEPLEAMGATVETSVAGTLPVRITGGGLRGLAYRSPVASAQVKTAVLLAGLRASGETAVTEPAPSRDHTERLLPAFGVPVLRDGTTCRVTGPARVRPADVAVPSDPSSAAFIAVAAAMVPGSVVRLPGVSLNPTRVAFLEVLERMGADVGIVSTDATGAEPVGTVTVRHAPLRCTTVGGAEVPALIDEVPVLALAAACATGVTRFAGIGELRVKESDRLEAIARGLSAFGAHVRTGGDWLEVTGPASLVGARVSSHGDHRLAMTWALAGLVAAGGTVVEGFDAVRVSYPGFADDLAALGAALGSV